MYHYILKSNLDVKIQNKKMYSFQDKFANNKN